jgi:hypothetical protein
MMEVEKIFALKNVQQHVNGGKNFLDFRTTHQE